MEKLYEIIKITDKKGNDRLDGRYPLRIGRRCELHTGKYGFPVVIDYVPRDGEDYSGRLRTSGLEDIEITNKDEYKITTKNSVYYLKELF